MSDVYTIKKAIQHIAKAAEGLEQELGELRQLKDAVFSVDLDQSTLAYVRLMARTTKVASVLADLRAIQKEAIEWVPNHESIVADAEAVAGLNNELVCEDCDFDIPVRDIKNFQDAAGDGSFPRICSDCAEAP